MLWNEIEVSLHHINVLHTIELFTCKQLILCYGNFTSQAPKHTQKSIFKKRKMVFFSPLPYIVTSTTAVLIMLCNMFPKHILTMKSFFSWNTSQRLPLLTSYIPHSPMSISGPFFHRVAQSKNLGIVLGSSSFHTPQLTY